MRLGWHIGLPGPFYLGGTVYQSRYRRRYRVLDCGHAHRSQAAYDTCPTRGRYPAGPPAVVNDALRLQSRRVGRALAGLFVLALLVGVAVHLPFLFAVYAVVAVIVVIRRTRRHRGNDNSKGESS